MLAKGLIYLARPFFYLGAVALEFIDTIVQVYEKSAKARAVIQVLATVIGALSTAFFVLFTPVGQIGAVLTGLAVAASFLAAGFGAAIEKIEAFFASWFAVPRNPPNAFQGFIQLVEIFTNFGSAMFNLEKPLKFITSLMNVMFEAIFSSFGLLKDAFALLLELAETDLTTVNETFDSVSGAANSLNKISLAKMAMLTAGSTANSLAQSVDGVSKAVTAMSGGDNERPLQIHVRIDLDGGKFADKVINITSREIERLRRDG